MNDRNLKIRIGKINYTNVWPIFYYFPHDELGADIEMIQQVPTELNRAMALGETDMGPISSFAYGENCKRYLLFPDLSVSAYGKVNSILLFYKKPFERVINGRIALPTTSATSVNLLKIIIEKFHGGKPEYTFAFPSLHEMMNNMDAALLIGDDAIKASWSNHGYEVIDLGEKWRELTGKWMSFAVWSVRQETVERHPDLVTQILAAFQKSKSESLRHPEEMIRTAQRKIGGTYDYWQQYFSNLCYDFDQQQQEGLSLYFRYAYELGLISNEVSLRIWEHKRTVQVKE